MNNSITFQKELLGVQDDLLRFAYKLTSDQRPADAAGDAGDKDSEEK